MAGSLFQSMANIICMAAAAFGSSYKLFSLRAILSSLLPAPLYILTSFLQGISLRRGRFLALWGQPALPKCSRGRPGLFARRWWLPQCWLDPMIYLHIRLCSVWPHCFRALRVTISSCCKIDPLRRPYMPKVALPLNNRAQLFQPPLSCIFLQSSIHFH